MAPIAGKHGLGSSLLGQKGQGTVEFVIIMVLFLAVLGGVFEMTRVFRAKHTLNEATFLVARTGALNHARLDPMVASLGEGMVDLFMTSGSAGSLAAAMIKGRAHAEFFQLNGAGVRIVSPTKSAFDQLAVEQFIPSSSGNKGGNVVRAIPNDNLRWRPNDVADLGDSLQLNLKDANLLKVHTTWCQRLVVPGLDIVVHSIIKELKDNSAQQACNVVTGFSNTLGIQSGRYIAITADATVRMQTAVAREDLP